MKDKLLILFMLGVGLSANAQTTYTLEQCLDSALTNNIKLKNAALDIQMAREQKSEAYTKYFPEISASATAFYAFDKLIKGNGTYPEELAAFEPNMPGISQMVGQPFEFAELNRGYNVSLSVMQPLYAGGQITTGNKLASLQKDVMQLQLQLKEKDIVEKVTENYWQIAQLKYNLQTLDAADRQVQAVLNQVDQFVKAGITTSNDLLKVQLRQQELKSNRLKVENGIRVLSLLLAQQCGITSAFDICLPEGTAIQLTDMADASTAAAMRQEYQLATKNVEAQALQVKMERGKNLPTLAVGVMGMNMGMGGLSENVRKNIDTNITNGLALATVSIPISSWWGGTHAIRRQKMKVQQAKNDRQEALEMLTIDIESAWSNLQEAKEQVAVAETAVMQSEENLRQSNAQYNAGIEDLTNLLDAETLHRQSQNNLSSAIAAYQIAVEKYKLKVSSAIQGKP